MSNQILIKFKPQGDKSLKAAINSLAKAQERLNGNVERFSRSSKKGTDGLKKYELQQTRVTKGNSLLGGSFAVLRSKMLLFNFAMGLGVNRLIQFAQESSKIENMERAFNTLSGGVEGGEIALKKLQIATNGTMNQFDLFQQANNAMILGVSKNSDEMAEMFDIAQRLGRALGKDTAHSVESLITGIGRQSRLMLDNIGIIVKADEAYEAYAQQLNVTKDELTDAQKKQAFLNATMESARAKVKSLGEETLSTQDKFAQMSTELNNASINLGNIATPILLEISKIITGIAKGVSQIGMTELERFIETLKEMGIDDVDLMKNLNIRAVNESIDELTSKLKGRVGEEMFEDGKNNIDKIEAGVKAVNKFHENEIKLNQEDIKHHEKRGDLTDKILRDANKIIQQRLSAIEKNKEILEIIELIRLEQEKLNVLVNGKTEKEKESLEILTFTNHELRGMGVAYEHVEDKALRLQLIYHDMLKNMEKVKLGKMTPIQKDETKVALDMINQLSSSLASATLNGQNMGNAIVNSLKSIAVEIASKMAIYSIASFLFPSLGLTGTSALRFALGLKTAHTGGYINQQGNIQKFATGGMVQGQDNVPILAQAGEFVMSKRAVDAVGLETMNRINRGESAGSITLNISGNVMSDDFVEDTIAPKLKEAIRRGADIGVS